MPTEGEKVSIAFMLRRCIHLKNKKEATLQVTIILLRNHAELFNDHVARETRLIQLAVWISGKESRDTEN